MTMKITLTQQYFGLEASIRVIEMALHQIEREGGTFSAGWLTLLHADNYLRVQINAVMAAMRALPWAAPNYADAA
jgi:hypothetical protein